jgi:multiple antibiotic resistance protein
VSSVFDLRLFGSVIVTLLVIMNPIGAVPIFLALTRSLTSRQRVVSARRASLVALGVIAAFAVFGQQILSYLHISLAALQGAGGLLLLLVALQLLTGQDSGVGADAGVNVALVRWARRCSRGPARSWRRCWPFGGRMGPGVSLLWLQALSPHWPSCGCR